MQTKISEKNHFQSISVRPRFFAKFKVAYSHFGHFINVHFQKVTTYFSRGFCTNTFWFPNVSIFDYAFIYFIAIDKYVTNYNNTVIIIILVNTFRYFSVSKMETKKYRSKKSIKNYADEKIRENSFSKHVSKTSFFCKI
jgi:hypothetical protein